jgi:transposase
VFLRIIDLKRENRNYKYLKLVETNRKKGKVIQKTLLNFGNIEDWPKERFIEFINQLNDFCNLELGPKEEDVKIHQSFDYGSCFAIDHIWRELELSDSIRNHTRKHNVDIDILPCVKAMVFNRLLEPSSKLRVSEWIKTQAINEIYPNEIPLHHYYRSMDYLILHKESLEEDIFWKVNDIFNLDLSLVFYDLTSSYFEGDCCEIAKHGYSRDHRPDRYQIEIGLLVNREGIPIAHEVWEGNIKDTKTVPDAISSLKKRFNVKRCIFVGDNSMSTPDNIELLRENNYEYILSLKILKDSRVTKILKGFSLDEYKHFIKLKDNLFIKEVPVPVDGFRSDERVIICYNSQRAEKTKQNRQIKINESKEYLDAVINNPPKRGKSKKPENFKAMVERFLRRKKTNKYFTFGFTEKRSFEYNLKEDVLNQVEKTDGIWILISNSKSLKPEDVALGYRNLYEIENAFKEIKNFLRIRPIYHYKDLRVKAHVFICVLAYLIEKFIEKKIKIYKLNMSPEKALEKLKNIRMVTGRVMGKPINKITKIVKEQKEIYTALGIKDIPKIPTFLSKNQNVV